MTSQYRFDIKKKIPNIGKYFEKPGIGPPLLLISFGLSPALVTWLMLPRIHSLDFYEEGAKSWERVIVDDVKNCNKSLKPILGDPGAVGRGRAKWRDESFQERAEEPLGTKSHPTISKRLREYRLLIGQNNTRDFFCPIRSRYSQSRLEMVR